MTVTEENKKQVKQYYKREIELLNNKIDFYKEEILKLEGKTETCPHCNGEGRFITGHRDGHNTGPIYTLCIVCRGVGKVTKERVDEYQKEGAQFVYLSDVMTCSKKK